MFFVDHGRFGLIVGIQSEFIVNCKRRGILISDSVIWLV